MRLGPIVLCLAAAIPVRAATIRVAPHERTLTEAIEAATTGDTLLLAPGTYLENPNIVRKDLVLRAEVAGSAVIDAGGNGLAALRVVSSRVSVEGLVLRNGLAPFGAGILQFGGRVELESCQLESNLVGAYSYRGTSDPGALALYDCVVRDNDVGVEGSIETILRRTKIERNTLGVRASGFVDFEDVTVRNNGAPGKSNSGAVALGGAQGRLVRCEVRDNWSDNSTGGMWLSYGPFEVQECVIENNISTGGPAGLGIDLAAGSMVRTCRIRGNHARGPYHAGAGIVVLRSSLTIEDCRIEDNDSEASGGGVAAALGGSVTIRRSHIAGNVSLGQGGGVFASGTVLQLEEVVLLRNRASAGGGLKLEFGAQAHLQRCTLVANAAAFASGLLLTGAEVRVEASILAFHQGDNPWFCTGAASFECVDTFGNGSDALCGEDRGGNRSVDPQFCAYDPESAQVDLSLRSGSPLAGGGSCSRVGALPVGCVLPGATRATWSQVKQVYRGNN